MTSFSLRQVKLRPGEQYRDELEVELPAFEFGGQRYLPVPEKVPAAFEITRANTGTVFTLAFTARLHGPCYRCLGDAVLELPIHAREYQAEKPEDEELTTAVRRRGTCSTCRAGRATRSRSRCRTRSSAGPTAPASAPQCGKNLNDEPHEHEEEHGDPRWAALEALRDQPTRLCSDDAASGAPSARRRARRRASARAALRTPTSRKPHEPWQLIDASFAARIPAWIVQMPARRPPAELAEQRVADAAAARAARDVDRVLGDAAVARPAPRRRERRPAEHFAVSRATRRGATRWHAFHCVPGRRRAPRTCRCRALLR